LAAIGADAFDETAAAFLHAVQLLRFDVTFVLFLNFALLCADLSWF